MKYLLDTTAFSAVMRREETIMSWLKTKKPGQIVTAPPVMAEIEYGLQRLDKASRKYQLLFVQKERLLTIFSVMDWTPLASKYFGNIKAELEIRGMLIDDFDIAISAIALSHECQVLTANLKHFERVQGLAASSWW